MDRPTRWCDGHLDLAYLALHGHDLGTEVEDPSARCVSLPALARGRVTTVLGTIFTERGPEGAGKAWGYDADDPESAFAAGVRQLEWYETMERAAVQGHRGPRWCARCGALPQPGRLRCDHA